MDRFVNTLLVCLAISFSLGEATDVDPLIDIFPPKWHPGDILGSTDHPKIEDALADVDRAAGILDTMTVAMGVAALNGTLKNPRYKMLDGSAHSTMPYTFGTGKTGLLFFTKSVIGLSGVYGVLTYDIEGTDFMLAVMFSVPWNKISYNNKFNFKIYKKTVSLDKDLVNQMYRHAGSWLAIGYEERNEYGISLRGTMSDNPHSRLIVWVDASKMDESLGPSYHTECKSKTLGKRCMKECSPTGWCWTNHKCKTSDDCNSAMVCDGSCKKV